MYFVGNAHIDPVWMWRWQEGSAEAKATIRSALDRLKEYPEFIFVCGCSSIFEWIEEYDPESEYTDQGEHCFNYAIRPLFNKGFGKLTQAARLFNLDPTLIVENNHTGTLPDQAQGIHIDPDHVILTEYEYPEH